MTTLLPDSDFLPWFLPAIAKLASLLSAGKPVRSGSPIETLGDDGLYVAWG